MAISNECLIDQDEVALQIETSSADQYDNMMNPLRTIGRFHSRTRSMEPLPGTMRANADGTLAIYTSSVGRDRKELYTEIPFTAIHGMQTIPRDECDVLGEYADGLDICQNNAGASGDEKSVRPEKSKTCVENVPKGSITKPLLIATIAAAASQFLVGYNCVVLNTPEKYVFPGHSTLAWSVAVAALAIGGPIGAFFGGKLSDRYGRRYTLLLTAITFLMGGCVQTFAPNLATLTLARFIVGLASGVATVLVPIYLGELAPPHLRGTLGTINQFALVSGMFVADLLSFPFATEEGWRQLFSVTVFVAVAQILVAPFVSESPRWLLQQNPDDEKARQVLKCLRGYQTDDEVEDEMKTYIFAAEAHKRDDKSEGSILSEMMGLRRVRRLFFCSIGLHMAQQLCGISAVFYYSTSFFEGVIGNPLMGTSLIGAVNVIFTYVALLLMDSCRRKSLLLWSIGGMFCACLVLILSQTGFLGNNISLISVNVYVAFYEIGIGPIPWLIIAEMFEAKYVAVTMSICSQLNWLINFFVGFTFPTMHQALGEYTFVPFGVILIVSFLCTWKVLPETLGRTPEEVVQEVMDKTPRMIANGGNDDQRGTSAPYTQWQERTRQERWLAFCT